jgi:hypothetical protein
MAIMLEREMVRQISSCQTTSPSPEKVIMRPSQQENCLTTSAALAEF